MTWKLHRREFLQQDADVSYPEKTLNRIDVFCTRRCGNCDNTCEVPRRPRFQLVFNLIIFIRYSFVYNKDNVHRVYKFYLKAWLSWGAILIAMYSFIFSFLLYNNFVILKSAKYAANWDIYLICHVKVIK